MGYVKFIAFLESLFSLRNHIYVTLTHKNSKVLRYVWRLENVQPNWSNRRVDIKYSKNKTFGSPNIWENQDYSLIYNSSLLLNFNTTKKQNVIHRRVIKYLKSSILHHTTTRQILSLLCAIRVHHYF